MKSTRKRSRSILFGLALVLLLVPAMSLTAQAANNESTYTVTIPAKVSLTNSGKELCRNYLYRMRRMNSSVQGGGGRRAGAR